MQFEMKKRIKGLLSVFLVAVTLLTMIPFGTLEVQAADVVFNLNYPYTAPSTRDFEAGETVKVQKGIYDSGLFWYYESEDETTELGRKSYSMDSNTEISVTLQGAEIIPDTIIPPHKKFDKWHLYSVSGGDPKFYPLWKNIEYAINYDLNGGNVTGGTNRTSFTYYDEGFTLIQPVKEGFSFAGWTGGANNPSGLQGDLSGNLTIPQGTAPLSGNSISFTARWSENYTATVNNGTGGGEYVEGAVVNISANAPESGYRFKEWKVVSGSESVTFTDKNSATTSFSMPAGDVTVEAEYEAIPYTVTVNAGAADREDGKYTIGQNVSITADEPQAGYKFKEWQIISGGVALALPTSATTSFTMIAGNVEVSAKYEAIPYTVTVSRGTADRADGKYTIGQTVALTANSPETGYKFKEWKAVSGSVTFADKNSTTTSFTMIAGNVEVSAEYEAIPYTVTVNGGKADKTDGKYTVGQTVALTANEPETGYRFKEWKVVSGSVTFADKNSAATSFTMIAGNVEVSAEYEVIPYTVTVNGGKADKTDGKYTVGQTVALTANEPETGYRFKEWKVVSGSVTFADKNSTTTSFTMIAGNVEVSAEYEAIPYTVTVNGGKADKADGKYTVGQTVALTANEPETGYRFKEWKVESGSVTFADKSSAATSFTMTAGNVEVTAVFELIQKYTLVVENGTGSGEYEAGETVHITMNAPEKGMQFKEWKVLSGDLILQTSTENTMTIVMPACDVTITAVYETIPPVTTTTAPATTAPATTAATTTAATTAAATTAASSTATVTTEAVTQVPESPKTGDYENVVWFLMLAVISAAGVVTVGRKVRVKED